MIKLITPLVLTITFLSISTLATNTEQKKCTNIDIRSKLGSVRNQNGSGWCFGYTSADLITQFMKTKDAKTNTKVSAIDLAMMYYKSENKLHHLDSQNKPRYFSPAARLRLHSKTNSDLTTLWGGHLEETIKLAQEQGICSESKLHSGDKTFNEAIAILQALSSLRAQEPAVPDNVTCDSNYDVALMIFPKLKKEEFHSIMKSSAGIDYIYKLRDTACKERIKIPVDLDVKRDESALADQIDKLDSFLSSEIAVGISIYSKVFNPTATGEHAMSIVGRRYNKTSKQCEYMLRDSKGPDCVYFKPEHNKNCEQGHLWMGAAEIEANMKYLVYVSPKSDLKAK